LPLTSSLLPHSKEVVMPYTLWFQKAGKEALNLVGGKNASLGELIRADIPVPPGFSVTTEAYQEFLIEGGIKEKIEKNPFTHGASGCGLLGRGE